MTTRVRSSIYKLTFCPKATKSSVKIKIKWSASEQLGYKQSILLMYIYPAKSSAFAWNNVDPTYLCLEKYFAAN